MVKLILSFADTRIGLKYTMKSLYFTFYAGTMVKIGKEGKRPFYCLVERPFGVIPGLGCFFSPPQEDILSDDLKEAKHTDTGTGAP